MRRTPYAVLLAMVLAGCAAAPVAAPQPVTSPIRQVEHPARPVEHPASVVERSRDHDRAAFSAWPLGAHPLPLRPDGFGGVRPTPPSLRVRRYPTVDRLPPPADGRFRGTIGPVTASIRDRMGETLSPSCPVGLGDLRYLTVTFVGFDGRPHTGELVAAASVASELLGVFRTLYAARFPIEEMRLPTTADLEAPPTGDGNNTAGLVCRTTRGAASWSAHAYGLAIDINPFQNPYVHGDLVLPELASSYTDRDWQRPGMITPDGVVVRTFERIGWTWGGTFRTVTDNMHFSATGR